jgi:anti-sigma regulatory factor (Ser/Thr protein kinase)
MEELKLEATKANLDKVLSFIDGHLENNACSMKSQMQIDLAAEEIFVNIAQYSYAPATGSATIRLSVADGSAEITFIDSGIPYDPLAKEDPDITLSSEERQIGGLGIFLIKQYMDDVRYEYSDGQNKLTIVKKLS